MQHNKQHTALVIVRHNFSEPINHAMRVVARVACLQGQCLLVLAGEVVVRMLKDDATSASEAIPTSSYEMLAKTVRQ